MINEIVTVLDCVFLNYFFQFLVRFIVCDMIPFRIVENMITLRGKLKKDSDIPNSKNREYNKRVSVRDKLLIKEV